MRHSIPISLYLEHLSRHFQSGLQYIEGRPIPIWAPGSLYNKNPLPSSDGLYLRDGVIPEIRSQWISGQKLDNLPFGTWARDRLYINITILAVKSQVSSWSLCEKEKIWHVNTAEEAFWFVWNSINCWPAERNHPVRDGSAHHAEIICTRSPRRPPDEKGHWVAF